MDTCVSMAVVSHFFVAEERLDKPDVDPAFEHVGGAGVAE